MAARERVGSIDVDAGIIWVGDPCYVLGDEASSRVTSWDEFCTKSFDPANKVAEGVVQPLGQGVGLEVSTAYGDGSYPVFVRRNSEGRVVEVIIEVG